MLKKVLVRHHLKIFQKSSGFRLWTCDPLYIEWYGRSIPFQIWTDKGFPIQHTTVNQVDDIGLKGTAVNRTSTLYTEGHLKLQRKSLYKVINQFLQGLTRQLKIYKNQQTIFSYYLSALFFKNKTLKSAVQNTDNNNLKLKRNIHIRIDLLKR